jgi:uncharacterized membrane protein
MNISSQFILHVTAKILNSLKGNFKILVQIPITKNTITVDTHKSTINKLTKKKFLHIYCHLCVDTTFLYQSPISRSPQ